MSKAVAHERPNDNPTPLTYFPKYYDRSTSVKISHARDPDRLAYIRAIAERSPGPIYSESKPFAKATTFASSKRDLNFSSEISSNFYLAHGNPTPKGFKIIPSKQPTPDSIRSVSETPGPSTYIIKPGNTTRHYSVMRQAGRKDIFSSLYTDSSSESPGVGTYSPSFLKTRRNFYTIPQSQRRLDPKMSDVKTVLQPNQFFRS